jgi:hypothetical protein
VFLHAMAQDPEREQIDPLTGQPEVDAAGKPMKRPMKFLPRLIARSARDQF